ncbi:hypothetical protein EYC80_007967 [Monilinia laxa]|uniref:Uncharacterized protein n=1 Tax=Monilinia laxa TaxID=61186 RepID=A0A5N6JTS8_MONLA|nr:hypothetical protein EYC80_007967 [Monilinia laxa]
MLFKTIQITLLSTVAFAAPFAPGSTIFGRATSALDQVTAIAPNSVSCDNPPAPGECTTAAQAAQWISKAMGNEFTSAEIGSMISLMAFETEEFKYNINHYPGTVGQGTRNMQMPDFNLQYAQSIDALKGPLANLTTATTMTGLTADVKNQIMALILTDEYTWGTAPWFLKKYCADARPLLQKGDEAGWYAYLKCVGVGDATDPKRLAYWTRAKAAMGF